jgi:hypothetical protein
MATIGDSVGGGGENAPHDVSMVLLMLTLIKRKSGAPYYHGDYRNEPNRTAVKQAIEAFQIDRGLVPAHSGTRANG